MKTCPVCGHEGDQDVCPNDGSRLLTAEELENLAPTRMGETPFGGDETQVGEVGVTGFEATRAEEPVPVGLEATRAEEPAPAALLDPGADPSVDVSADVSAALPGPRPVKTQAPAVVPKRAHPVAVPVSESELRGENFGQWAEPKIKKKPK
ncbi:MAG: hypothetical protein KC549_16515, partial [Myxococcales bacterium]|nr:hypothetical protein [Myxococcales bacterium]